MVKTKRLAESAAVLVLAGLIGFPAAAQQRDQIRIVGSSTVFPYSQAAAEDFANRTGAPAPVVEATGTGGGMQIFCGGLGPDFPDITGASRAMTQSEWELCQANGVNDITEVLIGYDGLAIAISRQSEDDWSLTEAQLFQALASEVEVDGEIVANPYARWSEIDPSLPDTAITVFGPPPTSGTRDAFVELAMHDGCEAFEAIAALEGERKEEVCSRMRQDGPYIEAGENDNLIVQRLNQDSDALGIFGYSFLYENSDRLKAVAVEGVKPTFETIGDGSYGIARPVFIYIKNGHRQGIPYLNDFVEEFVSDAAMGERGYFHDRGLTVLGPEQLEQMQERATEAVPYEGPDA